MAASRDGIWKSWDGAQQLSDKERHFCPSLCSLKDLSAPEFNEDLKLLVSLNYLWYPLNISLIRVTAHEPHVGSVHESPPRSAPFWR